MVLHGCETCIEDEKKDTVNRADEQSERLEGESNQKRTERGNNELKKMNENNRQCGRGCN